MLRQRYTLLILSLVAMGFLISNATYVAGWSKAEITASAGSAAPTIDGVKESLWNELTVNITYHTFTQSNRQIALYAYTYGGSLYVLVEAQFITNQQNESISLILSTTNQTTNESAYLDRKMVTMINATQYGNESSYAADYFRVSESTYHLDYQTSVFNGKAGFGSSTRNPRVYEFQIPLVPQNSTEDIAWTNSKNYAIKVGINNTASEIETSDGFLIQLGQKLTLTEKKFGEFDFDPQVFLNVVLIIIAVIYAIVGVVILVSHNQVEPIKEEVKLEEETPKSKETESEEAEDDDSEEEKETKEE